jgi:hypothetical protein
MSTTHHSDSSASYYNPIPQNAPGASAALGHTVENSIPLSIFPIGILLQLKSTCIIINLFKKQLTNSVSHFVDFQAEEKLILVEELPGKFF